jgi:hypothetical protein
MIKANAIFKKAANQVSCRIDDEVAILDLQRELYFGIQGAGVQLWEALEQPRTVGELCALLCAEFDVSQTDCQADVEAILESLETEGLVEIVAPDAA